jgi:hypothetical protein
MKLNIITPCSRPENLHLISNSINIPKENYRWIVVFDFDKLPNKELIPNNCEVYLHKNPLSKAGHAQRNYALELIDDGYVYSNDDDTLIHPELWGNIKDVSGDFISFKQAHKNNTLRLVGNNIRVTQIDNHNFMVSRELIGDTKFRIDVYEADGHFAMECFGKAKNPIYLDKILSVYNSLR